MLVLPIIIVVYYTSDLQPHVGCHSVVDASFLFCFVTYSIWHCCGHSSLIYRTLHTFSPFRCCGFFVFFNFFSLFIRLHTTAATATATVVVWTMLRVHRQYIGHKIQNNNCNIVCTQFLNHKKIIIFLISFPYQDSGQPRTKNEKNIKKWKPSQKNHSVHSHTFDGECERTATAERTRQRKDGSVVIWKKNEETKHV